MEDKVSIILAEAQRDISENGVLSFPVRRKLWLAFGPWEAREEDDPNPRALTEPMKKRAELALACAGKVSRIWSAYAPEDKRPQKLIKEIRGYLDGRYTMERLSKAGEEMKDFCDILDEESDSTAPSAAMAVWGALITALHDEPLLEKRYENAEDSELDSYDWDAAREASEAWAGAEEEAGQDRRKARRMKFWAWYLEAAAKLLGDEEYRFPPKAVKAFQEKLNPPKPIPKEVTLESLADYLDVGRVRYCCRIPSGKRPMEEQDVTAYHIVARRLDEGGVCPKCGKMTAVLSHYIGGNAVEGDLPGNVHFMVVEEVPFFRCPDHPKEYINAPNEYVNYNALFRKYIAGAGRAEALKKQVEERAVSRLEFREDGIVLNDRGLDYIFRRVPGEEPVPGLRRTGREDDGFAADLSIFGPNVFFLELPYEEFVKKYPGRVRQAGERMTELDFAKARVSCFLDEKGILTRVEAGMKKEY